MNTTSKSRAKRAPFTPSKPIVLTQVVGIVEASPDGEDSMLVTAFKVAGEFIAENATIHDTEVQVITFEYNDEEFEVVRRPKGFLEKMRSPANDDMAEPVPAWDEN